MWHHRCHGADRGRTGAWIGNTPGRRHRKATAWRSHSWCYNATGRPRAPAGRSRRYVPLKGFTIQYYEWCPSSCYGGYHLEGEGMTLYDAVWIHCEKGATTNIQGADVKCMGYGVYVGWLRVCVIWLDMATSSCWREKDMVYYVLLYRVTRKKVGKSKLL